MFGCMHLCIYVLLRINVCVGMGAWINACTYYLFMSVCIYEFIVLASFSPHLSIFPPFIFVVSVFHISIAIFPCF